MKNRALILCLLLLLFPGPAAAVPQDLPFKPGEKLTFELKWGIVPAGTATLEVYPLEILNGQQVFHFVMTAESNSFVDIFYKVRDRIDAYTDADMTRSVFYKKYQSEGRSRRDIIVTFDWEKGEACYTNFGRETPPVRLLPASFDPLSILYFIRMLDLKTNQAVEQPVTDGKKMIIGKTGVIGRETLELANGTHKAILMEPDLTHIGGVFEKSKNAKMQLWLSDDQIKVPLLIKSKVRVGNFSAELISIEYN